MSDMTEQRTEKATRKAMALFAMIVSPFAIVIVLLTVSELGLRAAGYGSDTHYFLEKHAGGPTMHAANPMFYQQFLSMSIENMLGGGELGFEAPDVKPTGVCRVFVFGGSAAQGCTPDYAYGMCRVLETMLRSRFPGVTFEVYNAACPALNSHVMRLAAEACARIKPDVFLVYMGNNEFYGPFGPAWLGDRRVTPSYVNRWVAMRRLRLVQWLSSRASSLPHVASGKSFFDMLQRFPSDAPVKQQMYDSFRSNLEAMCSAGKAAGAKVALCTVPVNVADWSPFASLHREGLGKADLARWDDAVRRGDERWQAHDAPGALAAYREAEAFDNGYAELHFKIARCLAAQNEFDNARDAYLRARDLDALQMRTDTRINAMIAEVAKASGADLLDVASDLEAKCPNRIADNTFFWDFVHLNFSGNCLVASVLFKEVAASLTDVPGAAGMEPPPERECAERLGMTPAVMAEHARKMQPAFAYWGVNQEHLDWLNARIGALEQEAGSDALSQEADGYLRAMALAGDDYYLLSRYVRALAQLGRRDQATLEARRLAQKFPSRKGTRDVLSELGLPDSADTTTAR